MFCFADCNDIFFIEQKLIFAIKENESFCQKAFVSSDIVFILI